MSITDAGYALFLGCTAPVRTQGYELATRRVAFELGINLVDLDFNCCGFPLESLDSKTALAVSFRNLALAEKEGFSEIATICSGCAGHLEKTNHLAKENNDLLKMLNDEISGTGLSYTGTVRVRHFTRILYDDYKAEAIGKKTTRRLNLLQVAPYYGCHFIRPTDVTGAKGEIEEPFSLHQLITVTGAKPLDYPGNDKCCGGFLLGIDQESAFAMSRQRILAIKDVNPDAIVLICPFCGMMMENMIKEISTSLKEQLQIPVLYYPQLLGLALEIPPDQLGLNPESTGISALLRKLEINESN